MHHDLQEQIRRGELRAGDRVPSENQLAEAYQVSRQTVRKALAILEQEGAIYALHGKGTFVSERVRPEHKSHNIAVVTTYLSDYIFPRVIQGIDEVLTAQGYSILLKIRGTPGARRQSVWRNCCRRTSTESSSSPVKARSAAGICTYTSGWRNTASPMCLSRGALTGWRTSPRY